MSQTVQRALPLALPLGLGLLAMAAAALRLAARLLAGGPAARPARFRFGRPAPQAAMAGLLLAAALVLGFAMPWPLVRMLSGIAEALQ